MIPAACVQPFYIWQLLNALIVTPVVALAADYRLLRGREWKEGVRQKENG
jgi:hypothetical protein